MERYENVRIAQIGVPLNPVSDVYLVSCQTKSDTERISERSDGAGRLLDEVVADRVYGELGVRAEIHLLEDARAVGADGFHAQVQLFGNL